MAFPAGRTARALSLLALVAPAAGAAQWYFRPDNGTGYGLRNGASYADAWHLDDRQAGAGHLDWSRIKPGDTLFICGYHHSGRDRSLRPKVSGAAGNRIVIDGQCPAGGGADPGVLMLGNAEFIGGWTGPDPLGVYSRAYVGSTEGQLIEDTDNAANGVAGLKRLARRADASDSTWWHCGTFAQAAGVLYYKPSDADGNGACDAPHWTYASASDSVSFIGVSHFVLRNLVLLNQDRLVNLVGAQDVSIEGNLLRWATYAGIRARQNSDGGSILNNRIHLALNGILMENQVDFDNQNSQDNWVISGNEIYGIDQNCYYACQGPLGKTYDTSAIAFQGGSGNRISWNHIHHVGGSGVIFYAMRRQAVRGNVIEKNFIHDVRDLNPDKVAHPERSARGIEHGGSGEEVPDDTVGNLVRYNVLANIDHAGIRVKSSRPSTGYSWSVLNNTLWNVGTSFCFAGSTNLYAAGNKPGFRFQNNISASPASGVHLDQMGGLDADTSGIVITSNLFYPDNTPGTFRYEWGGTAYEAVAAWRSVSGKSGGLTGDPRFNGAGGSFHWASWPDMIPGAGDFDLQSASPAINTGGSIADSGTTDMDGVAITTQRDIGAYEGR